MPVTLKTDRHIAVIQINNPPVNALSQAVREGLCRAIETVNGDAKITGVILAAQGHIFIGGADIKEFGKPPLEPFLPNVIDAIEQCRVPTLAVLNGAALGGGLEVALGCRYRIAHTSAKLGLPEVNLGLIPGAGGTQRLPRLIGAVHAGEMVSSGKPLGAEKAFKHGIVDGVFADDLLENAIIFLQQKLDSGDIRKPLSAIVDLPNRDDDKFAALVQKTKMRARGQLSPLKALEAVAAAQELPFLDGMKKEREIFMQCMESEQRDGLIHAFFAVRQLAKIPGLAAAKPRTISNVTILGAGTMGVGIVLAFIGGGYTVQLFDINADALQAGMGRIEKTLTANVAKGRISQTKRDEQWAHLQAIDTMDDVVSSDLIIEAATENMQIKKSIFTDLDRLAKPGAILATNTSYLDINILAAHTKRPQSVIGMHFFSPAHIMKLLEVIRTDSVSDETIATVMAVGKSIGKISVLSGVCDGFIGNRILKSYRKQAEYMVQDGAAPQDVDRVMRRFGFAMGPFEVSDLAGIDIGWHTRRREDATRPPEERTVDIADRLYEMGRLGQKTGAGWYKYEPGSRTPLVDPVVEKLIVESAEQQGIARRKFDDGEILDRIMCAMMNEGAKILGEGIAARALDIDMVYVHGYGFPAYRGGPMFYADKIGAKQIYENVLKFSEADAYFWQAADLLKELAETGGQFKDI